MVLAKVNPDQLNVGDEIAVKVGGVLYLTVLDEDRRQRFIHNPDHFLVKRLRTYSKGGNPEGDVSDLNEMGIRYALGEFTKRDYAEMNMALGYTLNGFCEFDCFQDWEIDNPAW